MSDTPRSDDEQRGDFVHIRFARQLERENAALKAALDHQMNYQRELRADKDRLDWLANLDEKERLSFVLGWYRLAPKQVRREIDAAMQEGKQ